MFVPQPSSNIYVWLLILELFRFFDHQGALRCLSISEPSLSQASRTVSMVTVLRIWLLFCRFSKGLESVAASPEDGVSGCIVWAVASLIVPVPLSIGKTSVSPDNSFLPWSSYVRCRVPTELLEEFLGSSMRFDPLRLGFKFLNPFRINKLVFMQETIFGQIVWKKIGRTGRQLQMIPTATSAWVHRPIMAML